MPMINFSGIPASNEAGSTASSSSVILSRETLTALLNKSRSADEVKEFCSQLSSWVAESDPETAKISLIEIIQNIKDELDTALSDDNPDTAINMLVLHQLYLTLFTALIDKLLSFPSLQK